MSFANAQTELHSQLQAVGLTECPDEVQDLVDADLGQFEGSYQLKLIEGAEPFPSFALTLTEFTSVVQIEIGAEINNDRSAANVRLNGYMRDVWRQVVSDLSWATDCKSLIPVSKPVFLFSPAQPNRLVMAWQWQLIYLE